MRAQVIKGGTAKQRKQRERAAARRAAQLLELNRGPNYRWWHDLSEANRFEELRVLGASLEQCTRSCLLGREWDALPLWARRGLKKLRHPQGSSPDKRRTIKQIGRQQRRLEQRDADKESATNLGMTRREYRKHVLHIGCPQLTKKKRSR